MGAKGVTTDCRLRLLQVIVAMRIAFACVEAEAALENAHGRLLTAEVAGPRVRARRIERAAALVLLAAAARARAITLGFHVDRGIQLSYTRCQGCSISACNSNFLDLSFKR